MYWYIHMYLYDSNNIKGTEVKLGFFLIQKQQKSKNTNTHLAVQTTDG